jgi:hypothetical protein
VIVALTNPPTVLFLEAEDDSPLPSQLIEGLVGEVDWFSIREVGPAADIQCTACQGGVEASTRLRPVRDRAGVIVDLEEMAPISLAEAQTAGRHPS